MNVLNKISVFFFIKAFICLSCFEELLKGVRFGASGLKYAILFAMIIVFIFSKNHRIKKEPIFYFIPFYIYFSAHLFFDFSSLGRDSIAFISKIMLLPIWALILNKFNSYEESNSTICKVFVNSIIAYAILNPFLFFIHLPIWNESFHTYWGRISVGYPTVDAILVAFALICIFFVPKLNLGKTRKIIYTTILCLSIGIMASGSGLVYLFIIFSVILFRKKNHSDKTTVLATIGILVFLAGVIFTYLSIQHPELTENLLAQVENRVDIILKGKSDGALNVNTIDIRKDEFDLAKKMYLENHPIREFLGAGFTPITRNSAKGTLVFIESQYHFNMFCLGYIGMFFYILFFVIYQMKLFSWFWRKYSEEFWKYTLMNIVFCLGASMVIVLLSWGIIVTYVYFVHSSYIEHKFNKTIENQAKKF